MISVFQSHKALKAIHRDVQAKIRIEIKNLYIWKS